MQTVGETARQLRSDAALADERRLLVLSGDRDRCYEGVETAVGAIDFGATATVSDRDLVGERVGYDRVGTLLGRTYDCIVVDCHDTTRPNAIAQATGAVDGGGLLFLLTPPLSEWSAARGRFTESLAPPPFAADAVGSRFNDHLVGTLRAHRGVSIVDVDAGRRTKHRRERRGPRRPAGRIRPPPDASFPDAVYEACLSADQRDAVAECERLSEAGTAVVLEADRGRGKSSAAGLAAAAFALDGDSVAVTAPGYRNAAALFERAAEILGSMDVALGDDRDGGSRPCLHTPTGEIRFLPPREAVDADADVLFVDEAAAIPVRALTELSSVARGVCFSTTVRGYEGAGRGFDVRFRGSLEECRAVTEVRLSEPIRYAAGRSGRGVAVSRAVARCDAAAGAARRGGRSHGRDVRTARSRPPRRRRADAPGGVRAARVRPLPDTAGRSRPTPGRAGDRDPGAHRRRPSGVRRAVGARGRARRRDASDRPRGRPDPREPDPGSPDEPASRSRGRRPRRLPGVADRHPPRGPLGGVRVPAARSDRGGVRRRRRRPDRRLPRRQLRRDPGAPVFLVRERLPTGPPLHDAERHERRTLRDHAPAALRTGGRAHGATRRVVSTAAPGRSRGGASGGRPGHRSSRTRRPEHGGSGRVHRYRVAPGRKRSPRPRALRHRARSVSSARTRRARRGGLDDPDAERLLVVRVLQNTGWAETAARLGYVSERECKRALGAAYRPIVDRYGGEIARAEADRYSE